MRSFRGFEGVVNPSSVGKYLERVANELECGGYKFSGHFKLALMSKSCETSLTGLGNTEENSI